MTLLTVCDFGFGPSPCGRLTPAEARRLLEQTVNKRHGLTRPVSSAPGRIGLGAVLPANIRLALRARCEGARFLARRGARARGIARGLSGAASRRAGRYRVRARSSRAGWAGTPSRPCPARLGGARERAPLRGRARRARARSGRGARRPGGRCEGGAQGQRRGGSLRRARRGRRRDPRAATGAGPHREQSPRPLRAGLGCDAHRHPTRYGAGPERGHDPLARLRRGVLSRRSRGAGLSGLHRHLVASPVGARPAALACGVGP